MRDKNYNPYDVIGRWYKIFIESDSDASSITTSDIEGATLTGNILKMPEGFHIVDVIYDFNSVEASSVSTVAIDVRLETDGCQSTNIASAANFDYANVYIFGHYN